MQEPEMSPEHNNTDPAANTLLISTLAVIPLAAYTLFITTVGLLGNSLVVYSSVRYNAIQLDKVTVLFVQNLAIADLCYILCNVLPSAITYLLGRYVLGSTYCYINGVIALTPGSVNTLTILSLTSYRLLIVLSPYRAITIPCARVVVGLTWLFGVTPSLTVIAYRNTAVFVRTYAACVSDIYDNEDAFLAKVVLLVVIIILPILATTVINAILCAISVSLKRESRRRKKAQESLQNVASSCGVVHEHLLGSNVPTTPKPKKKNRPILTVCLLSGCFVASWVPYSIYVVWKMRNPNVPSIVEILAFHGIQLNTVCNPILYTMTNRRFGRYVKQLARSLVSKCLEKPSLSFAVVSTNSNSTSTKFSPTDNA
jgi:hypothetical protein